MYFCKLSISLFFFCICVAITQEKQNVEFRKSIEGFAKGQLHHIQTEEKNPLPDSESMYRHLHTNPPTYLTHGCAN